MEYETKKDATGKWWSTILMAAIMVGILLFVRKSLSGWLLPDGRFLESLAQQVQSGEAPMVEAVFSGVQEWFIDD